MSATAIAALVSGSGRAAEAPEAGADTDGVVGRSIRSEEDKRALRFRTASATRRAAA